MRLAEEVSRYGSVAVAGLAKNTGKTVVLNHLLRQARDIGLRLGVTSIGIDGESTDSVTRTEKPEIRLYPEMVFATSETHYRAKALEAEILDLDTRRTSLGRTVTARARSEGKILLSGPSDTSSLRKLIGKLRNIGCQTVIVDGALSRVSQASPATTDAMILSTGAALSPDINVICNRTAFVCSLINLPPIDAPTARKLLEADSICEIDPEDNVFRLNVNSALELEKHKDTLFSHGRRLYVPGMVGDKLLSMLTGLMDDNGMQLIIKDFTRLFVEPLTLKKFQLKGGEIKVLKGTKLIAVTVNPFSPNGYTVDAHKLKEEMQSRIDIPVINVLNDEIQGGNG